MDNSKFLSLNWQDFLKGFVTAIMAGVVGFLYETLLSKGDINWENIAYAAIVAGVGYLAKNFTTNSAGSVLKTEGGKFLGIK